MMPLTFFVYVTICKYFSFSNVLQESLYQPAPPRAPKHESETSSFTRNRRLSRYTSTQVEHEVEIDYEQEVAEAVRVQKEFDLLHKELAEMKKAKIMNEMQALPRPQLHLPTRVCLFVQPLAWSLHLQPPTSLLNRWKHGMVTQREEGLGSGQRSKKNGRQKFSSKPVIFPKK